MSLAISCLKRKLQFGNSVAYIEPPTVRQSIEIIHVLSSMEDEEDLALLFELIAGLRWQGRIDIVLHLRKLYETNRSLFAVTLRDILLQGYSPKKAQSDEGSSSAPKPDWAWFLHQYCRTYNAEPWQVYNMPFSFFMVMLSDSNREKAKRQLDQAFTVSAGFGSKELIEKWSEQAELKDTAGNEDQYSKPMSEEEKKESRKSFKKRMMQ